MDWDIPDPAGKSIEDVRAIRDELEERVKDLVEHRLDAIRADRTSHELRLQRLLPDLVSEFAGIRSDAEIRSCADAILADYADVPVRSFVMTIAHRRTRDCLGRRALRAACQCLDQTCSAGPQRKQSPRLRSSSLDVARSWRMRTSTPRSGLSASLSYSGWSSW